MENIFPFFLWFSFLCLRSLNLNLFFFLVALKIFSLFLLFSTISQDESWCGFLFSLSCMGFLSSVSQSSKILSHFSHKNLNIAFAPFLSFKTAIKYMLVFFRMFSLSLILSAIFSMFLSLRAIIWKVYSDLFFCSIILSSAMSNMPLNSLN